MRLGDDSTQYAEGFGLLQIHLPNGQNTTIDRVYYVPVSNEDALTSKLLQSIYVKGVFLAKLIKYLFPDPILIHKDHSN